MSIQKVFKQRLIPVLLGAAVACLLSATAFTQPGQGAALVTVTDVVEGEVFDEVRLVGSAIPPKFSFLSAEVDGIISERLVDEGDPVREGQVLFQLRATPTELRLQEAAMMLQLQRAEMEKMENGERPEDISVRRAQVDEAAARVALARAEEERAAQLLKTNVSSQSNFDRAKAELERARAELAQREAELDRAISGERPEDIARAKAQLAAAEARVAQLADDVDRHAIKAPYSGVVGRKEVEVGQWVQTGDTLISLARVDPMHIEVGLPEIYFNRLQIGDIGFVEFDSLPGERFEAPIVIKIPIAEQGSRTIPIRLEVKNAEHRIAPGMVARVRLLLQTLNEMKNEDGASDGKALLVPKDALVLAPGGKRTIYLVGPPQGPPSGSEGETGGGDSGGGGAPPAGGAPDGPPPLAAFPVEVTTGRAFLDSVEIIDWKSDFVDLENGSQVIIRGNESIQFPGQPVRTQ